MRLLRVISIPLFLLATGLTGIYNGVRQTNVNYNWHRRNEDTTTATTKTPSSKDIYDKLWMEPF
jgi:hypothetical protein